MRMSDSLTRDIPSHYIVFLFVNGLAFLLLTPIFLTYTSFNPLARGLEPSEALACIGLISAFSFVAGAPGLIFYDIIIGSRSWVGFITGTNRKRTKPSI